MKVLFIGGTGIISSACSELAISKGIDLYHLNRGVSSAKRSIAGVKSLIADIRDVENVKTILSNHIFDVVVNWIAFEPEHIIDDIEIFRNKTNQYIFISSASIYETPPKKLPVTEETPLENPIWIYSQQKIECEKVLRKEYEKSRFPYTIVRPSHTYDKTLIPLEGGYTILDRMINRKPIVVHGDGSSLWTLTNHRDFATGFVGLLGNSKAINEAFHITSDELLSWDSIVKEFARALNVEPKIVHVPSEIIARYNKEIGNSLLGDKTHSMIFDNSKIKKLVPEFDASIPFSEGVIEIVDWYRADISRQVVDNQINDLMDELIKNYS